MTITHKNGEENKSALKIMKIIFTSLSVKEICLWNLCKLPIEPQGFLKNSLNTTASVDGYILMKGVFFFKVLLLIKVIHV